MKKNKKYEMRKDEKSGLYRIVALRDISPGISSGFVDSNLKMIIKGDLGGLIEGEENLSQDGECWIGYHSKVIGKARVKDNALVITTYPISGLVRVEGYAIVLNDSILKEKAYVKDRGIVKDNAIVGGNAEIKDNAIVGGNAIVSGNAMILGEARVEGDAEVLQNAIICGESHIHGKALITGNAKIDGEDIHGIIMIHKTPETKNKVEDLDNKIKEAIIFLKSNGYRVYKKIEEWKEIE